MAELGAGGLNGWFGETWHAPCCQPDLHVTTPVGELCIWCGEPIAEGDRGLTCRAAIPDRPPVVPQHVECSQRSVLGGALCHEGTCSHCGDGSAGAISDDPSLTRREAAIAALAAFERKHGRYVGA